jgi:phenylalanyl-tRNA synthetase beta chain
MAVPDQVDRVTAPMMIDILNALEFKVTPGKNLTVEVPTFRPDVTREIDVVEEIARIYGYDKIPSRLYAGGKLSLSRNRQEEFAAKVRSDSSFTSLDLLR